MDEQWRKDMPGVKALPEVDMTRIRMIALMGSILLVSCTSPKRARDALSNAGYSDIQTGGYDLFSCGEDDVTSTKFTAKNPKGETVRGTVCCGITKSCTIRF